jgi:hypothetical protein
MEIVTIVPCAREAGIRIFGAGAYYFPRAREGQ